MTLEQYKQITQYEVLPGQKICRNYVIFNSENVDQNEDIEEVMTGDSDQLSVEAAAELVNDLLEMLECSPLKTLRSDRTLKLGERKTESAISKLRGTIAIALNKPQLASSKNECNNCARLVKEKLVSSNRERKIQLLTLVRHDWSVQKTCNFFGVFWYAVCQARKLRAEKRILTSSQNYSRVGLSSEIKQLITEFYESDKVCRLLPRKKDCIYVKLTKVCNG